MKKIIVLASALLLSAQAQAAIVSVGGNGEIIAAVSVQEDSPTNTLQQGFNEQQGVMVGPGGLAVDGGTIAAGTRVDSHLIFLNSAGNARVETKAEWTFSGVILGVMSDSVGQLMKDSNATLAAFSDYFTSGSSLPFNAAGLEGNDSYSGVGTSSLTLSMLVTEPGDWIRVVTVSEVPVPAALFLFAPALLGFLGLRRKAKAA
jgi:hypothetical protein